MVLHPGPGDTPNSAYFVSYIPTQNTLNEVFVVAPDQYVALICHIHVRREQKLY